jgi:hypothetical protein
MRRIATLAASHARHRGGEGNAVIGRSAQIPAAGPLDAPEELRQAEGAYAAPGTACGGDSVAGVDRFPAAVVRRAAWQ